MDSQIEALLVEHIRQTRLLQAVRRPEFTEESAESILRAHVSLMNRLRQAERNAGEDRNRIREHIEVSRSLMRLRAREFRFAYVDPDDGEGASPIYAPVPPLPLARFGRAAEAFPWDD